MMTWSANPIQNKPLVNPLAPEEIAKRQEKMTWSSTTVAAKVVSNSNIVNSNTSIKKISSHISTDKLSERKNAMTWTNNATAVHNSSNSSTFANSYNSQRGGVNFGRGRRGGASQTLVSPRTNMTWTAGSTNQTNSQNNSQYTTPNNSNNESNNQQQQNVIFGSAVISQHPGSARGVFTPRGRGSYRARGSFRGRGSFIANRFNKFDNQSFQNQQWVKSGNNNVNDMNNQVQQISNTLPETPPPP